VQRLRHRCRQTPVPIDLTGEAVQTLVDRQRLAQRIQPGHGQRFLHGAGVGQHLPTALDQPGVRLVDAAFFADRGRAVGGRAQRLKQRGDGAVDRCQRRRRELVGTDAACVMGRRSRGREMR
jgi:hypothetical protein